MTVERKVKKNLKEYICNGTHPDGYFFIAFAYVFLASKLIYKCIIYC